MKWFQCQQVRYFECKEKLPSTDIEKESPMNSMSCTAISLSLSMNPSTKAYKNSTHQGFARKNLGIAFAPLIFGSTCWYSQTATAFFIPVHSSIPRTSISHIYATISPPSPSSSESSSSTTSSMSVKVNPHVSLHSSTTLNDIVTTQENQDHEHVRVGDHHSDEHLKVHISLQGHEQEVVLPYYLADLLSTATAATTTTTIEDVPDIGDATSINAKQEHDSIVTQDIEDGPRVGFHTSVVLTENQMAPIFKFQKKSNGKVKVLNAFSLYTIFICILTCPFWALSMYVFDMIGRSVPNWDPDRALYDKTGKIWCKIFLALTHSYPTISGDLERIKENNGSSCLFVANHASFLDIAVLCTVLDPVFKFIAKCELKAFPFIGQQLTGGNHILIDRNDRRSQLRAFKEGVAWLQKGVPLMAFPEGTRSKDGRLMDFKGGMFSMAVKSKVPIVPISISNTHAVFPSNAFMPVQSGYGKLHVHVHPPITVDGKTEEELAKLVREALLSKMPLDQHPLEGQSGNAEDDEDDDE